jgi:Na+-translocating ferredoxin:NAD+ oxidoreductase RnfC subunit
MYSNEAVNRLIETLAEEAERDLRHAKNAESPEEDVAYALYSASKYALNTVREWACREKQPARHLRSAEVDELKKKIAALKAENERLWELLGAFEGSASEIVRALAGEADES